MEKGNIKLLETKLEIANRMLKKINSKIDALPDSNGCSLPPVIFMDDSLSEEFISCLNLLNEGLNYETFNESVFQNYPWHHKFPKSVYRLESKTKDNGLWYNSSKEMVFGIGKLEDCDTKYLPMDWDERYHVDGFDWWSSCSEKEDLFHWYSLKNAEDLISNGFVFTRYTVVDYIEYEFETVFLKETSIRRDEIDINLIFEEEK